METCGLLTFRYLAFKLRAVLNTVSCQQSGAFPTGTVPQRLLHTRKNIRKLPNEYFALKRQISTAPAKRLTSLAVADV
jgi:hypothetical protein